ncbi:MAG: hypothetical protein NVS9B14_19760 [Candidatus Acidiferrum sp.]
MRDRAKLIQRRDLGANQMSDLRPQTLLETPTVTISDTECAGTCRLPGSDECATTTRLVFPYRGVFTRFLGSDQAVAESNQVLFFNAWEGYKIGHPVPGGDSCLSLSVRESLLTELAPQSLLHTNKPLAFRQQRLRIDARAQALVALLRYSLRNGIAEPLEAEGLALTLVQRSLGPRTSHVAASTRPQSSR